jgi:hypothetical protein
VIRRFASDGAGGGTVAGGGGTSTGAGDGAGGGASGIAAGGGDSAGAAGFTNTDGASALGAGAAGAVVAGGAGFSAGPGSAALALVENDNVLASESARAIKARVLFTRCYSVFRRATKRDTANGSTPGGPFNRFASRISSDPKVSYRLGARL